MHRLIAFQYCLLLVVVPVAAQVEFTDSEFPDANWSTTIVSSTGSPNHTAVQQTNGGSPGAYREMRHNMSTVSNIWVFHEYLPASYDPADGSIASLSYSESRIQFDPPFSGAAIGASPALRQGNVVFFGPVITYTDLQWVDISLTGLTAADFTTDDQQPDFSSGGAPIHFGFLRWNSTQIGASTKFGIDNWRFEISLNDDSDGDGVPDDSDNCIAVPNADQRDTNDDGFGNVCDADLDNDCTINVVDLGLMKAAFFGIGPDADLNGDGSVNVIDLGFLKAAFFAQPGPSGLPTGCDN